MTRANGTTEKNGAGAGSAALARSARREEIALRVEPEDGEHLDRAMLEAWILDKSAPHQRRQRCVVFVLFHDHKVNGEKSVTSSTVIAKDASDDDRQRIAREAAEEFDYESREVARHFPDLQRFFVCGYKKEGATDEDRREDPEFTKNFSVSPPPGSEGRHVQAYGGSGGELDAVQIITELVREKKDLHHQLTQNMQADKDRLTDLATNLIGRVDSLMTERYNDRLRLEEALNQHQTREAEALERRMRTDAQWMLFQGGFGLLKKFAEQWMAARDRAAGGVQVKDKDGGEAQSAVDAPFLEFARTLEPPQILTIISALSPEQQEQFQPMATALISAMPPEKQSLMLDLFKAHQAHVLRQKEEQARAAAEASGIEVTVQGPDEGGRK